jgi:hypothetical protein
MTSFTARCAYTLAIALLSTACGSAKVSASAFDETADGSTTGDTSATGGDTSITPEDTADMPPKKDTGGPPVMDTATPPPDTGSGPVTLDNVCTRLADATCSPALGACCGTKGITYKADGCRAAVLAGCGEQVKAAKIGKVTFSAAAFPFCATALNSLATKCDVPILDFLRSYAECNQLLQGFTSPGSPCMEDWECKVSEGAFASCSSRDNRCESIAIVGKDAICNYGGSARAICTYGQACYFTSGASGQCKPAKTLGSSCNQNFECGFGNWCQRDLVGNQKCVAGGGLGASCTENFQCASSACSGGKCTDPNASLATPELCTGAAG